MADNLMVNFLFDPADASDPVTNIAQPFDLVKRADAVTTSVVPDPNPQPTASTTKVAGARTSTIFDVNSIPIGTTTIFDQPPITTSAETTSPGASSLITTSTTARTTTTSTASSSTGTGSPEPSTSGISVGAIAGAAVGSLVAGLFIGLLGAWFLFRRRSKQPASGRQLEASEESHGAGHTSLNEAKSAAFITTQPGDTQAQLSQFLLDGVADQEIASELQSLGVLIYQHVENYYHLRPVQSNASDLEPFLSALGFEHNSGLAPDSVAALCIEPRTRQTGLRHVISHVVLRSIDVQSSSQLSMFPAPVATFLRSVPANAFRGNDSSAVVSKKALSEWRRLSAFLLHPNPSQRTSLPVSEAIVSGQIAALTAALNAFLQDFIVPGNEQAQRDHLQALILECTKLGYVLLSHPSDWQFIFANRNGDRRSVVVCPGLEKLSDGKGSLYKSARGLVAPEIVSV